MIYALVFAQQYGDAKSRLNDIRECLTMEGAAVHAAILLVRTMDDSESKSDALLLFVRAPHANNATPDTLFFAVPRSVLYILVVDRKSRR